MGVWNFLRQNKRIVRLATLGKGIVVNVCDYVFNGAPLDLSGLPQIFGPILLYWACMGLVHDLGDIRKELALKKAFNEKRNAIMRPLVYVSLNLLTFRIALRRREMTRHIDGYWVYVKGTDHAYRVINYTPSIIRNLHSRSVRIAKAKALRNIMLDQKSLSSQRDLYHMIRVLRSCLVIRDYYIRKCFYEARMAGEKQITMDLSQNPRIYIGKIKKPIGAVTKSQIRTCQFFQILLKHVKVAERGEKTVNRSKDSPAKIIMELLSKEAEEFEKISKKESSIEPFSFSGKI